MYLQSPCVSPASALILLFFYRSQRILLLQTTRALSSMGRTRLYLSCIDLARCLLLLYFMNDWFPCSLQYRGVDGLVTFIKERMQFSNFTITPSAITPCGEDKVKINFTIVGTHNMKTMFDIPVCGKQVSPRPEIFLCFFSILQFEVSCFVCKHFFGR